MAVVLPHWASEDRDDVPVDELSGGARFAIEPRARLPDRTSRSVIVSLDGDGAFHEAAARAVVTTPAISALCRDDRQSAAAPMLAGDLQAAAAVAALDPRLIPGVTRAGTAVMFVSLWRPCASATCLIRV